MATSKKKSAKIDREAIIDRYIILSLEGEVPKSIYSFCKDLGINESEFYDYFGSFEGLEKSIWQSWIHATMNTLNQDQTYQSYQVKEKLLAFYYTHFEQLKRHRSFILLNKAIWKDPTHRMLNLYKRSFQEFVKELVAEGIEQGQISARKYITDYYSEGFWLQLLFVLRFWIKDDSAGFEQTDAAIEKAVHLSFELISPGPLEAVVDFAKFVIQNR